MTGQSQKGCDPGQAKELGVKASNLAWGSRWLPEGGTGGGKGQESSKSNIEGDHGGLKQSSRKSQGIAL